MKKLVLIMAMLVGLSSPAFAGAVGESSTDCIKNQSTQARAAKEVEVEEVQQEQVNEKQTIES